MSHAAIYTVIHAPSFAGGRLLLLNRLLRSHAAAIVQADRDSAAVVPQVRLILDDNLTTAHDLRLPVQNAHGDVVHLEIPDHGKLGYGSRAALAEALLDTLPPTAQVEAAVDFALPAALQTPLEAATTLWTALFPDLHVETIPRGSPSPAEVRENAKGLGGITWYTPRHQLAIEELGLTMELVLQGESVCKQQLSPIPAGELGARVKQFLKLNEMKIAELKPLAEQVDPKLIGSWARLRREWRSSMAEFSERAERAGRNRAGIRNTRLHSLAQALRPHNKHQEQGLAFLSACASFQLNYHDFSDYLTTLSHCVGKENVQIPT